AVMAKLDTGDALNRVRQGQAWLGQANMAKDGPGAVAELHVGEAMVQRSIELDESLAYSAGHAALGAYHARTAMAELDASYKHFARAIELTRGQALLPKFTMARTYFCMKGDKVSYEKMLKEIIDAPDSLPEQ